MDDFIDIAMFDHDVGGKDDRSEYIFMYFHLKTLAYKQLNTLCPAQDGPGGG